MKLGHWYTYNQILSVLYSGTITVDELRQVMESMGESMTKEELDDMIQEADGDGNGEIDYHGQLVIIYYKLNYLMVIPIVWVCFYKEF